MVQKPIYLYRITDNVYHIYKFSNYGIEKIKLINAGLAYSNKGDYTEKFKKLMSKYKLKQDQGMHTTSDSYRDFISRIYLDNKIVKQVSYDIPHLAFDRVTNLYKIFARKKEEKLIDDIHIMCIRNRSLIEKCLEETKNQDD